MVKVKWYEDGGLMANPMFWLIFVVITIVAALWYFGIFEL